MISIIIPTLNEESVLENTLSWIKRGLTVPHEVIITDGHSKDRTIEIARRLADKVVEHDGSYRQTIAEGRNAGAAAMDPSSQFAVFIDADCTIKEPDTFFKQVLEHFEREPELVALNVAIRVLPENETFSDKVIFSSFNGYLRFVNNGLRMGISAGEFQMIRRTAFEKVGGYDKTLIAAEDVDLFRRLRAVGYVRYEPGLTIYHTGRRAHKMGWPKLLYFWVANPVSMMMRGKAVSKEWKPIR